MKQKVKEQFIKFKYEIKFKAIQLGSIQKLNYFGSFKNLLRKTFII